MTNQVYKIITDEIIKQLDNGVIPWRKPWSTDGMLPANFVSKREYTGINPFLLNAAGYECPFWVTFKQARQLGGHVRKGEKSSIAIFWKPPSKSDETDDNGKPKSKPPILRYYRVFNLAQCDGINWEKPKPQIDFKPIDKAQKIADGYKPVDVKHGMARACYHPQLDYIEMPAPDSFHSAEEYYSTLFHEMAHSTGHKTRLDRDTLNDAAFFGSHEYSREELVAEFAASFLCGISGIERETLANSAAYIAGWKRRLKDDDKLVIQAAKAAQKAADYIQGVR